MIALILILLVVLLSVRYQNNYHKGLGTAVFLLVLLTSYISIKLPGDLPSFTVQRIVLICMTIFWFAKGYYNRKITGKYSLVYKFVILASVGLVSTMFSIDLIFSIKTYLSFPIELFLLFVIIATSIRTADTGVTVLKSVFNALFVIAILGIIEKKIGFNPVDAWLPGYTRNSMVTNDVITTFPHRIHFGLAMAMASPIALGLSQYSVKKMEKVFYLISSVVILIACYFSDSRGPWMAALLSGIVLFILGTGKLKRKIVLFISLSLLGLLLRPGVRDTLGSKVSETTDKESFKGETYQYRWELWNVAYKAIKGSFKTMVIGTGPGTTEVTTFQTILSYNRSQEEIWSWDNEYAATLLETGFLGLFALLVLHVYMILLLYNSWQLSSLPYKDLAAAILASITGLIFMMTNVKMFSPQINSLTWILVAIGIAFGRSIEIKINGVSNA